jgi:hypothetical protein
VKELGPVGSKAFRIVVQGIVVHVDAGLIQHLLGSGEPGVGIRIVEIDLFFPADPGEHKGMQQKIERPGAGADKENDAPVSRLWGKIAVCPFRIRHGSSQNVFSLIIFGKKKLILNNTRSVINATPDRNWRPY